MIRHSLFSKHVYFSLLILVTAIFVAISVSVPAYAQNALVVDDDGNGTATPIAMRVRQLSAVFRQR